MVLKSSNSHINASPFPAAPVSQYSDAVVVREHSHAIRSGMGVIARFDAGIRVCTTRNDELLAAIDAIEKDDKEIAFKLSFRVASILQILLRNAKFC